MNFVHNDSENGISENSANVLGKEANARRGIFKYSDLACVAGFFLLNQKLQ